MIRRLFQLVLVAMATTGMLASAAQMEREGRYITKYTPYNEIWHNAEGIKVTAQIAAQVLESMVVQLHKQRVLPNQILNLEDLEAFRKSQSEIDDMVDTLNQFIHDQRKTGSRLEMADGLPDALIFFGGKKISVSLGKSFGGSLALGLVLMPTWFERFDVMTNKKVEEGLTFRHSIVVWPAADAGFGLGGGLRWRAGVGFIWGNDNFVDPAQFWGAGPGVSWSPVVFGAGVNAKVGSLANWEMEGWLDFVYASIALEVGAAAELGTPRLNISTVVSGPAVMNYFEQANKKAFMDINKEIARSLDQAVRQYGNIQTPIKDKDKDEDAKVDLPGRKSETRVP